MSDTDEQKPMQVELTPADLKKLVVAMKNAMAIGQTLEHHGRLIDELAGRVQVLTNHIQTAMVEQQNLKSLYHRSLMNKYGNGPTT